MSSPLTIYGGAALFAPQLFGTVGYYAAVTSFAKARIDYAMRYDKRNKDVHRYRIADTRGPLELTVPVSRPSGACTPQGISWYNVKVSAHGKWWEIHRQALESAYGRTPFFEFWSPRLWPLLSEQSVGLGVSELVRLANEQVLGMLGVELEAPDDGCLAVNDLRRERFEPSAPPEYYQVRAGSLGFIPNLSILDLLFNVGPESVFVLQTEAAQMKTSALINVPVP